MKLTLDKIEVHPPHAFSPREARALVRLLPCELVRDVSHIRFTNALAWNGSTEVAQFSRLERRILIRSRGLSRAAAIQGIVECLARANLTEPGKYGTGPLPLTESDLLAYSRRIAADIELKMPIPSRWIRAELRYAPSENDVERA